LTNGLTVTFKCEAVTLSMALDALTDIRKELEELIKKDHDATTIAPLMRKRARKLKPAGE
jgi:hypothetical protein